MNEKHKINFSDDTYFYIQEVNNSVRINYCQQLSDIGINVWYADLSIEQVNTLKQCLDEISLKILERD